MHDRSAWTRGAAGPVTLRGKKYSNLVQYTRPCKTCGAQFSIYVTKRIDAGHADSNSFGYANCEQHRRGRTAADAGETAQLRTASATMTEELEGLYARNRQIFEELQQVKAKLAQYELPEAMQAAAGDLNLNALQEAREAFATDPSLTAPPLTFPWEQR
jgi:hypothetical protein